MSERMNLIFFAMKKNIIFLTVIFFLSSSVFAQSLNSANEVSKEDVDMAMKKIPTMKQFVHDYGWPTVIGLTGGGIAVYAYINGRREFILTREEVIKKLFKYDQQRFDLISRNAQARRLNIGKDESQKFIFKPQDKEAKRYNIGNSDEPVRYRFSEMESPYDLLKQLKNLDNGDGVNIGEIRYKYTDGKIYTLKELHFGSGWDLKHPTVTRQIPVYDEAGDLVNKTNAELARSIRKMFLADIKAAVSDFPRFYKTSYIITELAGGIVFVAGLGYVIYDACFAAERKPIGELLNNNNLQAIVDMDPKTDSDLNFMRAMLKQDPELLMGVLLNSCLIEDVLIPEINKTGIIIE
ncbi:MAG: hypothetical protein NTY22_05425 [Proteobacteria bacterium]|nr:hypothetical protein [Pseudomonadota bacterium]